MRYTVLKIGPKLKTKIKNTGFLMKSFPMRALPSAADNDVPQAEVLLAPRGPAHSIHTPTIWRYGAT